MFIKISLIFDCLTESAGDANARRAEPGRYEQLKKAFDTNPKYRVHYEKLNAEGKEV